MSFPYAWVDALFARLTVRYGAAFLAQWPDADSEALKADWCEVLAGFGSHPEFIRYALENLPEKPPNAVAFRLIARRAPPPQVLRLPEPAADPARVAQVIATAKATEAESEAERKVARSPSQIAIDGIIRRVEANGWTTAQRRFVATCAPTLRAEDPRIERMQRLGYRL